MRCISCSEQLCNPAAGAASLSVQLAAALAAGCSSSTRRLRRGSGYRRTPALFGRCNCSSRRVAAAAAATVGSSSSGRADSDCRPLAASVSGNLLTYLQQQRR